MIAAAAARSRAETALSETDGLGLSVVQNEATRPLTDAGAAYQVTLLPGPFALRVARAPASVELAVALSLEPGIFDRFGSARDPVFGPASGYARAAKPGATLYLTDPACRADDPSGFNILGPEHARAGLWPISRIEPDRLSDDCRMPSVPSRQSLIASGLRLYLVAAFIRDGAVDDGADFLVLDFTEPASG